MGKQTKSYPCGAFTLKEGEQAGRKIDVGTVSGTEEIVGKIILCLYSCLNTTSFPVSLVILGTGLV